LDWKVFGEAIRVFYGLNGKGNAAAKVAKTEPKTKSPESAPTQQEPGPQNSSTNPLLAKVRQRLEESKISEPEFLDILRAEQIPEAQSATSLESIPDKPLSLSLSSWNTVTALAEELRARETEAAR